MIDIPISGDLGNVSKGISSRKQFQSFREAVTSSSQWFVEAQKIITTSTEWEDIEEIPPDGDLAVQFNKLTLDRLRLPWKLTLMGKCLGINIKPNFMETRVRAVWRTKYALEVIDIGKNVFLFRLTQ